MAVFVGLRSASRLLVLQRLPSLSSLLNSHRSFCSEKPSDRTADKGDVRDALRKFESVKVSQQQKRVLVITGYYKSMAEVPDSIKRSQLAAGFDRFRIIISLLMLAVACIGYAIICVQRSGQFWESVEGNQMHQFQGGLTDAEQKELDEMRQSQKKEFS